jgi:hypothetical protein
MPASRFAANSASKASDDFKKPMFRMAINKRMVRDKTLAALRSTPHECEQLKPHLMSFRCPALSGGEC